MANNQIGIIVKVTKNAEKGKITFNPKDNGAAMTGTLIFSKGFSVKGESLDDDITQCTTVVTMTTEMALAIHTKSMEIFSRREEEGDPNPTVGVKLVVNNILALNTLLVKKDNIISFVEVVDDISQWDQDIESIRARAAAMRNQVRANNQAYLDSKARPTKSGFMGLFGNNIAAGSTTQKQEAAAMVDELFS